MNRLCIALFCGLLTLPVLAADPDLGRNLAATCASCHGTNGVALPGSGIDTLAGQDKERNLQRLKEYRAGIRAATIMHQISKGYTEEQLILILNWFAAQK